MPFISEQAFAELPMLFADFMSDEALMVNLEVQYGAIGDHIIYQVNMTRADDAGALMLVTDSKGRVRHVTQV